MTEELSGRRLGFRRRKIEPGDFWPATASTDGYRPQCTALTSDGSQCRNSARGGSKYCGSHKGYQPPGAKQRGKSQR